jgi:ariadne-1
VKQTSELLFLSPTEAACLLRHYGWKSQKLQADWLTDSAKVRASAGLSEPKPLTPAAAAAKTVQCSSAFCDEVPKENATALNCGHWFCDSCWTGYLVSQVKHGRSCVFATCMGMRCTLNHPHKFGCACKELVPESIVKKYVKEADLIEKYNRSVPVALVVVCMV